MLTRAKRDWFPVVATDLFCGVLAAVIILDAVAPKEVSTAGTAVLLTLTYESAPPQNGEPPNTCRKESVVFRFRDASTTYDTLGEMTFPSWVNGECRVETFLPEVNTADGLHDTVLVVAQYAGDLITAKVTITGLPEEIECRTDRTTKCPIL